MTFIINLFKQTLRFPVMWVGMFYLFWLLSVPIDESYFSGIILFGIYLIITILVKLCNTNWKVALILLVILLPVAWEASMITLWLLSGWLDRKFIFTILTIILASYPVLSILRQPSSRNKSLSLLMFVVTLPTLALNIMYFVSYFPKVVDKLEFGGFKYYILSEIDMDYHSNRSFYKCAKWSLQCDVPYSTYSRQDFKKIIVDKEKNEVSAISSEPDSRLVFTYGENSRLYEGYPEQLGDHVYQMSTDYGNRKCGVASCDIYIYTLYECKSNYTSCNPLPIQYTRDYEVTIVLNANAIANEIDAYDNYDDTKIFTYGKHPQCYVEGCMILEQK